MCNSMCDKDVKYNKFVEKLISSITYKIGSGNSYEINNSLNLLYELTICNIQRMKINQTPIMLLIDYMEQFNTSQIRLLYKIISILSINIDSNNQLQIGNNLMVLITKQLSHSGFIHQQESGIIGYIQLIGLISKEFAYKTDNAKNEAGVLLNKLFSCSSKNMQWFATMCDEFSLMIENSRNYNGKIIPWIEYNNGSDNNIAMSKTKMRH